MPRARSKARRNPTWREGKRAAAIVALATVAVGGFVYAVKQWRKGMLLLPGQAKGDELVSLVVKPIPSPTGTAGIDFAESSDPRVVANAQTAVIHARAYPIEVRVDVPEALGTISNLALTGETWLQLGGEEENYAIVVVPKPSDVHGNPSFTISVDGRGLLEAFVV